MPYHGNNKTAQQKNSRTNNAYGRLNQPQGTRSDRRDNDHITGQFRNRFSEQDHNRNGEQDTNRVSTQQNYNVNDNISKITRPKDIRWAGPPQEDEPYIKREEE